MTHEEEKAFNKKYGPDIRTFEFFLETHPSKLSVRQRGELLRMMRKDLRKADRFTKNYPETVIKRGGTPSWVAALARLDRAFHAGQEIINDDGDMPQRIYETLTKWVDRYGTFNVGKLYRLGDALANIEPSTLWEHERQPISTLQDTRGSL